MSTTNHNLSSDHDAAGLDQPGELDLSLATWRTSTYSGGNGSCVEVAELGTHVAVRDSKDRGGAVLVFAREEWHGFISSLKKR